MDAYASFRSRDYRFLLAGSFLSSFGLQMLSVAVSWDLYVATKSAVALGNVGLVQVTPFLVFALFAGHFADRHDRRIIMLVTQVMLLAACIFLAFNSSFVPIIYGCLFLTATARTFQGPARMAILPHVVPADTLRNAITWNSSANEIASVSGPAMAGILLASAGSRSVYIVQCCCATLTLYCFYRVRFRAEAGREISTPTGKSVLEGVRFVWTDKLILSAMSLDLFSVLFGGATALLPIYAVEILHTGARGLGWLRAAPSIGAVVMALTQTHFLRVRLAGRALLWSVGGFGAAMVVFGLSRSLVLSFTMLVITGALDNISVVLRNSLVQTATPDRVRGRVLAVNNIFISCSNQLGAVESGWTAAWFGPIASVVAGGMITMTIVATFAAKSRLLRQWRQ
ncbi:MAG: MFS transporter [Bryobacteraceae bacterium]